MELEYLGHACIVLRHAGETLLVDPYESGQFGGKMGYAPIDVQADWVVCSHDHADHAATWALPGSAVRVESGRAGSFTVHRFELSHDEFDGRTRGGSVDALRIESPDGIAVLHLSDVGESPRAAVVEANRGVDVLLVPTGGFYTIGAAQAWEWVERIQPKVAIPIHYQTIACGLPIRGVAPFVAWVDGAVTSDSHLIQVPQNGPNRLILPPRLAKEELQLRDVGP